MNDLDNLLSVFVSKSHLAVEFDPPFYKLTQSDLSNMTVDELVSHYQKYGKSEGRIATPAAHREGFVAQIQTSYGLVLEIGPAVRPVLRGDNIRYFDIADQAGLTARANAESYSSQHCPVIHYVSPIGDLSVVTDSFDGVFSSHCIEHQPDLVAHLQGVAALLLDGGRYYLIVPDKRFCFDALLPESTLDQVIKAHTEKRKVHTRESVYDHYVHTTHNDAAKHWRGESDDPRLGQRKERKQEADRIIADANGGYVDVHAWQFTPDSFRAILSGLHDRGLCRFSIARIYDTVYGRHEFCAVLTLDPKATP